MSTVESGFSWAGGGVIGLLPKEEYTRSRIIFQDLIKKWKSQAPPPAISIVLRIRYQRSLSYILYPISTTTSINNYIFNYILNYNYRYNHNPSPPFLLSCHPFPQLFSPSIYSSPLFPLPTTLPP